MAEGESQKLRALFRGQRSTLDKEHKAILENNRGAVWIHAASVGEFEQARTLIEKLKIKNEALKIVVTFFSPSGYEARKNYDQVDAVLYLPFATRRKAKRFLDALKSSKNEPFQLTASPLSSVLPSVSSAGTGTLPLTCSSASRISTFKMRLRDDCWRNTVFTIVP